MAESEIEDTATAAVPVSFWQFEPTHGNPRQNLRRLEESLESQKQEPERPQLLVLPELALSGYLFPTADDARRASLTAEELVAAIAPIASHHDVTIAVGWSERAGDALHNSLGVVDGDGLRAHYRKIFLASIDHFFAAGRDPVIFDLGGVRFGVALCLDLWFPELMRAYLDLEVDVLLHPSAFGGTHTIELAASRARENDVTVLTCNRVGREQVHELDAVYCGRSRAILPNGQVLTAASDDREQWLSCDVRRRSRPRRLLGIDIAEQRQHWASRCTDDPTEA